MEDIFNYLNRLCKQDGNSIKLNSVVLSLQLITTIIISIFFISIKNIAWCLSSLMGGIAFWLPNMVFMFLSSNFQEQLLRKGYVSTWHFACSEFLKIFSNIIFLILAIDVLKAVFPPLLVTWLSLVVVQIIAPCVINRCHQQ